MTTSTRDQAADSLVYVGNAQSSDIHLLRLNGDGALTFVERIALPGVVEAGGSVPLAISPDRRFLYACLRGQPLAAASFAIDPATGGLGHLGSAPLPASMAYISTDRRGRFLFGASYGGSQISVSPIAADGIVQPPQQVIATEPKAHAILPDPDNRHVLATSLGGEIVLQFDFDADSGRLNPGNPPSVHAEPGSGPRHLVFHPNGRLVYLLGELDAWVTVFDYEPGAGQLSPKQRISALPPDFTEKAWAADIHLTPDGRFLYASERGSSTLAAFAVDPATGRLSPIASFPTETQPRGFAIDPNGRFLLSVGQLSDSLTCHAIDRATGELSTLVRHPVGKSPDWVEIIQLP